MTEPRQTDDLVQGYLDASAQDPRRPPDRVRDAAHAHALDVIAAKTAPASASKPATNRPAANQSRWKISLLASIALAGITGLLVLQFERGSVEEKELALGQPVARRESAAPAAPAAPTAAPAPPAKPSPKSPPAKPPTQPADSEARAIAKSIPSAGPAPASAPALADSTFAENAPQAARAPATMANAAPAARSSGLMAPASSAAREKNKFDVSGGQPALVVAANAGDTDEMERLLAQGAALNAADATGRTALMAAVINGHTAAVEKLLARGASRTLTDREGLNALQHAQRLSLGRMVDLLESR